jgi:hypothetical protein
VALDAACSAEATELCAADAACCNPKATYDLICVAQAAAIVGCSGATAGVTSCLDSLLFSRLDNPACRNCYDSCTAKNSVENICSFDLPSAEGDCRDSCPDGDDECICRCIALEDVSGGDGVGCTDVGEVPGDCCFATAKSYACIAKECAAACK